MPPSVTRCFLVRVEVGPAQVRAIVLDLARPDLRAEARSARELLRWALAARRRGLR